MALRSLVRTNELSTGDRTNGVFVAEVLGLSLESQSSVLQTEIHVDRYEYLNGPVLVKYATIKPPVETGAEWIRSVIDRIFPPKTTFFSSNPNSRRNLLMVEGW